VVRWSPVVADDTLRYDVADLERVSRLLASQGGSGWLVQYAPFRRVLVPTAFAARSSSRGARGW